MKTLTIWLLFLATMGFSANTPKNIIVCIADGCGYNQIKAAGFYKYGKEKGFVFEKFPIVLAMSTHSADGEIYDPQLAWNDFKYVLKRPTDSAASATAMACGVKTNNGAIAVDVNRDTLETIIERAEYLGKSSGVVSSVPFSHATPAAFAVHNIARGNYADISRDMIMNSPLEVIMGCGHPHFDNDAEKLTEQTYKYVGGKNTWEKLIAGTAGNDSDNDGEIEYWQLIQEADEFRALMTGETPERVIGIPTVHQTLQQSRSGDVNAPPFTVPNTPGVPSLTQMACVALNVLDKNPNGFFLMIEGGAVDWAGHGNQSGRMIEEALDFAMAIDSVVAWIERNSSWDETLVIVTGDHETGYLNGPGSGKSVDRIEDTWRPVQNKGLGDLPAMEWHSGGHSNLLIPVFAKGSGGKQFMEYADEKDPVRGAYIDNTEIGKLMFKLWAVSD